MFKPMIAEFGWSRADTSLAFFLNMVVYALALPIVGKLFDRYGPRWVLVITTLIMSAGYCLVSVMTSLWQFLLFYGVFAAVGFAGPSIPMVAVLTSIWFERRRGVAVSLSVAGWSVGQFTLIPVVTALTLRYGWRVSHLLIGVSVLVVNLTLACFVLRNPEKTGKGPLWSSEKEDATSPKETALVVDSGPALGLKQALGTPSFWLFLIAMFICGGGDYFVSSHLIPFATDHGISPVTAGNMLAWSGLLGLGGILIAGPISDLIGTKIPIALTFVIRFFLFLFILKYRTVTSLYVFALAFGFTYLVSAPLLPILMGRLYGVLHLGVLAGFVNTLHFLGGGFWGYIGGLVFDRTGSYDLVFLISIGLSVVAAVCTMLIREKRHAIAT
jgi:MFS family permease